MKTLRSIDVGYGNTKFVVAHEVGGSIDCRLFPSLSPLADHGDLSGGVLARRDTVVIEVNGCQYEVGPDVELALGSYSTPILHDDFIHTPEYLALFRGALAYMQVPEIDLLVAGLPVSLLSTKGGELKERLAGKHQVGKGKTVMVHQIAMLAQPLGGFIDHVARQGTYYTVMKTRNLVIDPGYFTLDWVVAEGIQPIPSRCGSYPGGMSTVMRRLAAEVGKAHKTDYRNFIALDRGLLTGRFTICGKPVDLAPFMARVMPVIDEAVNVLVNSIGNGKDIDNIVLVGGGALFFKSAIARRFPEQQVHVTSDPVYSNVRGFQIMGQEFLRNKQAL